MKRGRTLSGLAALLVLSAAAIGTVVVVVALVRSDDAPESPARLNPDDKKPLVVIEDRVITEFHLDLAREYHRLRKGKDGFLLPDHGILLDAISLAAWELILKKYGQAATPEEIAEERARQIRESRDRETLNKILQLLDRYPGMFEWIMVRPTLTNNRIHRLHQQQVIQQERLRALGQMASGIAHDFNNALAPIVAYSELLLAQPERLGERERVIGFLDMILTSAQDAAGVVRRVRTAPGPGRTDHVPGTPRARGAAHLQRPLRTAHPGNGHRAAYGQFVASLVRGQILGDVRRRREFLSRFGRHPRARQGAVLGRGDQPQGVPVAAPAPVPEAARRPLPVEDDVVGPRSAEVVAGGQSRGTASDHDDVGLGVGGCGHVSSRMV